MMTGEDRPDVPADDQPNMVHLLVDCNNRLRPMDPREMWAAWSGTGTVEGWPIEVQARWQEKDEPLKLDARSQDVTILSVVRRGLEPVQVAVMRLEIENQRITRESVSKVATEAIEYGPDEQNETRHMKFLEIVGYAFEKLPANWDSQLAEYLDCPASTIDCLTVGGPLAVALSTKLPIEDVLQFICEEHK